MIYNYIIVGGGPGGIFCADKLSELGYKVCLIESLETLGGCHRVRYVRDDKGNKMHTEHGPRVYLGSYLDFWKWIKTVGIYRDKHFETYQFDMFSKDLITYTFQSFNISEIIYILVIYVYNCILRIDFKDNYTLEQFSLDYEYSENGKEKLNRLSRLIDGGNLNKSLVRTFLNIIDSGIAYKMYQPIDSMDNIIWNRFHNKLLIQKVDILLNTDVTKIGKNIVNVNINSMNKTIHGENIIITIPPYALNKIKNASSLIGYNRDTFTRRSNNQQYESYVCASIQFKNYGKVSWGIADDHPWGLIVIDMGPFFKNITGSLFIISVTHPEKIDPITKKSANNMNKGQFLNRIVELIQKRYEIYEEPIYKTFSPNVKKINGKWIESDRVFLYSPPGWLKPDFNISKENKVFTTGHHIGDSYHEYNSIESAIQNASQLLYEIIPEYNQIISKPWRVSTLFWIVIIFIVIYIFKKS